MISFFICLTLSELLNIKIFSDAQNQFYKNITKLCNQCTNHFEGTNNMMRVHVRIESRLIWKCVAINFYRGSRLNVKRNVWRVAWTILGLSGWNSDLVDYSEGAAYNILNDLPIFNECCHYFINFSLPCLICLKGLCWYHWWRFRI